MTASSPFQALLPALDAFSRAKPGQRLDLPPVAGSGDALTIARLAGGKRMLVVVTANPIDAQRLSDEIAWLAPACAPTCCPTGRPCPTTASRPTRT
jgi:transcription-repair coupling factor (superfamily II helicase)